MGAAYSLDLRERVVAAVVVDGLSRNQTAARFGVAISTAVLWVRRFRQDRVPTRGVGAMTSAG